QQPDHRARAYRQSLQYEVAASFLRSSHRLDAERFLNGLPLKGKWLRRVLGQRCDLDLEQRGPTSAHWMGGQPFHSSIFLLRETLKERDHAGRIDPGPMEQSQAGYVGFGFLRTAEFQRQ